MSSSTYRRSTDAPGVPTAAVRLFLLVLVVGFTFLPAMPDDAPLDHRATEFSAARALVEVQDVAREAHAVGTPEHDRVRDAIFLRIRRIGLEPVIDAHEVVLKRTGPKPVVVENIIARLKGRSSARAVMIACHYDSAPKAPGAGDDGASVGAMLETMRALVSGDVLDHDVVFLFTDAEELGLVGADLLMRERNAPPVEATTNPEHPARFLDGVDFVMNFEARGSSGPSLMFETTPRNAAMIAAFAESASHPRGSSLMGDAYRLLPNDTDFTVFKRAGLRGLNFAFIGDYQNYHQPTDSVANLDARTLQHHGENMLQMTRRFVEDDAAVLAADGDAVYFNPIASVFVHYPARFVWPLTAVIVLLFGYSAFARIKRREASVAGIASGAAVLLVAILAATALAFGLSQGVLAVKGVKRFFPWGFTANDAFYFLALAAAATALALAIFSRIARRIGDLSLETGVAGVWVVLAVILAILLPGSSYGLDWPLLGVLGAGLLADRERRIGGDFASAAAAWGALPTALVVVPLVVLIFQGMMLGVAAAAIPFVVLAVGLAWGFFAPMARTAMMFAMILAFASMAAGIVVS